MEEISSGCYVIDADYTVIQANRTAREIYPQLEVGQKCYACLMGLDAPCGPCPVSGGKEGPHTYTDPIRGISETVDAVPIDLEGHGPCRMLVFSTVGNREAFAATLPTSENELRNLALIKALTVDFQDVFSVELQSGMAYMYRHNSRPVDMNAIQGSSFSYAEALAEYAEKYVPGEDREHMLWENDLAHICAVLKTAESMTTHYTVVLDGETHYYSRKIVRAGDAGSFENIIVGVSCDDEEVREHLRRRKLERNLQAVECDSLTGLYTREAFMIHAEELLRKHAEVTYDFCILKVENLFLLEQQYSRAAGERLIRLIGRLLKKFNDDVTCLTYMGSGTFASFTVNQPADERRREVLAFRDEILQESAVKNLDLKWSIYVSPNRELSVEEIVAKTQYALTTIRASRKEDYVEFDQSIIDRMEWERAVENGFENALAGGGFTVWYQPKYSVKTGKIAGAEALVRRVMPDGQLLAPERFVPVLENCGKIGRLDEYVFRRVCELQQALRRQGITGLPISVNLSRASMFTRDIAQNYADITSEYAVPRRNIPIEITESAAVRAAAIGTFADKLIEKGFVLDMDDFGAGYSSLASLQAIPFESIKLDKTLIDYIGRDTSDALLKHTIAFARETGKTVVAEGVENYEQFLFLKIAGCDLIQGFYYSRPVPEETFIEMLRAQYFPEEIEA